MSKKVCVIIGYGPAVGEAVLEGFTQAGFAVAILARNQERLNSTAQKYQEKGFSVEGFACDLSIPESLPAVLNVVESKFGFIDVAIYNATSAILGFEESPEVYIKHCSINTVSIHVAFATLLPSWKAAGKGVFLMTGGGLANNGAWSVGMNMQFGAPTKSYMRNLAQGFLATFKDSGIRVTCMTVMGLMYGGDTVTGADPEPEKTAIFKKIIQDAYLKAATDPNKEDWVDDVAVVKPN
eukprot:gene11066-14853_t